MHIPASMLNGQICPVTLTVGAVSVATVLKIYSRSEKKVSSSRWAGVTALIFALQMLNFPVASGTSGHLVGGVLAAGLLGIPAGILSLSLILLVQAVFFADGGMNALGANVINMALIGVGGGGLILEYLKAKKISETFSIGCAAFISVLLAALSCSAQVAASGIVAFSAMAKAMLSVHVLIGVGEAILTVALCKVLSVILTTDNEKKIFWRLALCCSATLLFVPLASSFPDGLEFSASALNLDFSQPVALISTPAAGLVGVLIVWLLTWGLAQRLART